MSDIRKIMIDGDEIEVDGRATILQACEMAGVEVPRFCFHERLSIAGNCRMCLVEVKGGPPKPAASCAMQVKDLRPGPEGQPPEVFTNTPMVKKAREGVMEFLLINHPLDCPICDQGGECDLQDQAMAYGVDFSRFREPKRAVTDLDLGPLVETHMTRCISCTRCVRFTTEVAGITQMGQTGRGEDSEITSYLNETLNSNMQGNIIDLCPVGALVSKPYAFTARPWELKKTETNIRVDTKGREVMRILPRNNDDVNEEWISDKTRFVWDGLRRQRLDKPYVREGGKLRPASWGEAFAKIKTAIEGRKLAMLAGDLVSCETVFAAKSLANALGATTECRVEGLDLPLDGTAPYLGDATLADVDDATMIQLIGTNPRREAPVLNSRLRKAWLNGATIGLVGEPVDLTYEYAHIGSDRAALNGLANQDISDATKAAPTLVILGVSALDGPDAKDVMAATLQLVRNSNSKLMILHSAAGRAGALDLGFATDGGIATALDGADVVYALGVDEIDIAPGPFVIYQGSHGDRGAHRADVILPAAAYTEESAIFVNTEGRPQLAQRAGFAPGDAKENWAILRALSAPLGVTLPFDSLGQLRDAMFVEAPHLAALGTVPERDATAWKSGKSKALKGGKGAQLKLRNIDEYLTNPIARASEIMGKLSAQAASSSLMAAE